MYDNCMDTINISIPEKLRGQANKLVEAGYYASFSDLTRTAVRKLISESELDVLFDETQKDYKEGKAMVLKNQGDIDDFFQKLDNE